MLWRRQKKLNSRFLSQSVDEEYGLGKWRPPGRTWHLIKFVWCECWMHRKRGSRPPLQSLLLTILDGSEFSLNTDTTHTHTNPCFSPQKTSHFSTPSPPPPPPSPALIARLVQQVSKALVCLYSSACTLFRTAAPLLSGISDVFFYVAITTSAGAQMFVFQSFLNEATFEYIERRNGLWSLNPYIIQLFFLFLPLSQRTALLTQQIKRCFVSRIDSRHQVSWNQVMKGIAISTMHVSVDIPELKFWHAN